MHGGHRGRLSRLHAPPKIGAMRWDIFCRVIDNHGDIGVCWRLAAQLADRGHTVRLFADDASALAWMAPEGHPRVEVRAWADARTESPGDVVIEAFGCELDDGVQAAIAAKSPAPRWINLEYLSAEDWVERSHGLPSPVMTGPARGMTKRFFFPGFTPRTGGLLRGPMPEETPPPKPGAERVATLFCYEPPGLAAWLEQMEQAGEPWLLRVTAGRATQAIRRQRIPPNVRVEWLPLLPQTGYDALLASADLNFVRGEDSFVRALWAGRPFVWNVYPQDDGAHLAKLDAFLDWLQAPPSLRAFHQGWNQAGMPLPAMDLAAWGRCVQQARDRARAVPDLVSQLTGFAGSV
jgi:hypothetical protein